MQAKPVNTVTRRQPVNVKATAGKCILISGHDLKDLYNLLEQTEGTGVNVYTWRNAACAWLPGAA